MLSWMWESCQRCNTHCRSCCGVFHDPGDVSCAPVPMLSFVDSVPLEVASPASPAVGSPAGSEALLRQVSSPASVASSGRSPSSYDQESGCPDFSPAYGIQLHDPRLLEYVGAPESTRLLSRSPEYWLHHLGHEKTLAAALQLQHDAGLVLSNVQVLQQFVTSLNRASSEVMQVAFDRAPFLADAMQSHPSYRVRRVAHYMAAMGLWRPPSSQGVWGPLPPATCNACMS